MCSSTVGAFSVLPTAIKPPSSTTMMNMFFAEEDAAGAPGSGTKEITVYDRLGFPEDKIAIGINASEVLQWFGNRDAIIEKFTRDNKGMEPEKVEIEVDKFMMDREMVEAFIAFEKRKADPRNLKAEAEATLSDPSTWGIYAVWITGGAGFAYVKNVIVEPKYASGEWEPIHIKLPGADRFAEAAAEKAASVDIAAAVDAISTAVDHASSVV